MSLQNSRKWRLVKVAFRCYMLRKQPDDAIDYVMGQMISLGGVYIKFIQLVALKYPKLISSNDRAHLIYDKVNNEKISVNKLVLGELGNKAREIYHLESEPFAAGSFAQVYRAYLVNGDRVVLKVLRPSIVKNINSDLRFLKYISKLLAKFNKTAYDLENIFKEFARITKSELNYTREAKYAEEFYEKYKTHRYLVIPKTYKELCSKHIIIQEYIDGISATEVLTSGVDPVEYVRHKTGSDLSKQLIIFGEETLVAMLEGECAHGDPHPGNIFFLRDNKIALIDFGIKTRSPSDKKAFFDLIKEYQKIYNGSFDFENYTMALMGLFVSDLRSAIYALDRYNDGLVSDNILGAIRSAALSIYKGSMQDVALLLEKSKYSTIFNSVINEDNRFGFSIKLEEPEFIRATHMYISLTESFGLKREVFSEVYTNVVKRFENKELQTNQKRLSPEIATQYIADWLDDVATKDVFLFNMLASRIKIGRNVLGA